MTIHWKTNEETRNNEQIYFTLLDCVMTPSWRKSYISSHLLHTNKIKWGLENTHLHMHVCACECQCRWSVTEYKVAFCHKCSVLLLMSQKSKVCHICLMWICDSEKEAVCVCVIICFIMSCWKEVCLISRSTLTFLTHEKNIWSEMATWPRKAIRRVKSW